MRAIKLLKSLAGMRTRLTIEIHTIYVSQSKDENQWIFTNHSGDETQHADVSLKLDVIRTVIASQSKDENQWTFTNQDSDVIHKIYVSQKKVETHLCYASQNEYVAQIKITSQ